ncbi:MAG: response regulator transcription factor [Cyanobacteria bacterium P01_C01_bin.72]
MIRTLVVDDQNIIREGIKVLLENSPEIELVGFAENGENALEQIEATKPDVVLLDINLPGIDGLTVANQIGEKFPQIKTIMLSSYEDGSYVTRAMASSAKGYLLKNVSSQELEWSIKLVHQGYSAFRSELLTSLSLENSPAPSEVPSTVKDIKAVSVSPPENNSSLPSPRHKQQNADELELLIARNQVQQKYITFKQQRRHHALQDVTVSRVRKTMMSFEFKLLVLIILFSLGFLVFVALS